VTVSELHLRAGMENHTHKVIRQHGLAFPVMHAITIKVTAGKYYKAPEMSSCITSEPGNKHEGLVDREMLKAVTTDLVVRKQKQKKGGEGNREKKKTLSQRMPKICTVKL